MGRNIDLTKKLSDEDKQWLIDRSRGYEVDENERRLADDPKDEGGPSELEWEPTTRYADAPFDEPSPNTRQVPRPVGVSEELASPDAEEEVEVDDLTVEELKDELREFGEPLDGNKADLQKRLKKALKDR
jgi:SAP domain